MNTNTSTLLKKLDLIQPNTVALSSWLKRQGISNDLQQEYKKNGWLKSIGYGAFLKFSSKEASLMGALYALQQAELNIHIGGLSGLNLYALVHYARFKSSWQLFANRGVVLPKWFANYKFKEDWSIFKTDFLPETLSLQKYKTEYNYSVNISKPERAILEALYLAPENAGLQEIKEIFDMLRSLSPSLLQTLLENCKSIRVKRLFLYFAENANHSWFKHIDLKKIDLGKGTRVIEKDGKYNNKYDIVIGALNDNE